MRGSPPGGALAAETAARWLAAFAAAPLAPPSIYALHDPVAQAARWRSRLAHTMPSLAAPARSLYAALMSARPPWPPSTVRMLHGDFVMEHVFVAPDGADGVDIVTVIDWDSCRPGDPAEDAGRFVASLQGLYARGHADADTVNGAVERFMATYATEQPDNAPRAPFYAALACLRKASRVRRDTRDTRDTRDDMPQRRRAARLLATAEALLVS
jgi:aminoglycoside phosphotransferase (APT) family kinase protein